ncbi:MAG: hypothetical protein ACT4QG_00790 [Sporichthyaceae bacterium]
MSTTTRSRAGLAGALTALALVSTAGCGNNGSEQTATAPSSAPVSRDLASYDAFVLGNAANDPANADVYAIRFDPFVVERITTDKRVSSLAADESHLIVAAADENIDQLASVTGTGGLLPLPGLGRPFAYSPRIVDGVLYFEDNQGDDAKGENRSLSWDLTEQKKTLLLQSKKQFGGTTPIAGGRLVFGEPDLDGDDTIVVQSKAGKRTRYSAGGDVADGAVGGDLLALTLVGTGDRFGDRPVGMVLLDLDNGRVKRVPGLQFVAWNPDATRLLARRTDNLADSRLVILDPAKPEAPPVELATVPGLAVFGGVWVRGAAPA